jgi:hypothetical protein
MDKEEGEPVDLTRRVTILAITCLLLSFTLILMGRRLDHLESRVTYLSGQVASKKIKKFKPKPIPVFIVDAKSYEKDLEKVNATDGAS